MAAATDSPPTTCAPWGLSPPTACRAAPRSTSTDLFWAVRGGKGSFGVITSAEIGLVELSRLYGGGLFFPGAATRDVLGAWLEWTASQPEDGLVIAGAAAFP